jgi:hypothetical protein
MTYRISNTDYETWDNSKDGDLMYKLFNICKICKGDLKKIENNNTNVDKLEEKPICLSCIRNSKIDKLWT